MGAERENGEQNSQIAQTPEKKTDLQKAGTANPLVSPNIEPAINEEDHQNEQEEAGQEEGGHTERKLIATT